MIFEFDNGNSRQLSLTQNALAHFNYPLGDLAGEVTFQFVEEPSAAGHSEFACTSQTAPGVWLIEVRNDLDTMGRDPEGIYEGDAFFQETIIHEVGHVITGTRITTDVLVGQVAACFRLKSEEGYPGKLGTSAEWSAGDWQSRIQEATAETIKDAWLPASQRAFENRTNWLAPEDTWDELCDLLLPPQGEVEVYSTSVPLMHPGPPNWGPTEEGWQSDGGIQYGPEIIAAELWAWLGTLVYSTSIGMNQAMYNGRREIGGGYIRVDADFTQEPWEYPTHDYPTYGSGQGRPWSEAEGMTGGWIDGARIINQYVPSGEEGITFGLYVYEEVLGGGSGMPMALWEWRMIEGIPIILGADIEIPTWAELGYAPTSLARFYMLIQTNGSEWTPHPGEPSEERVLPSRPGAPARWWQERFFRMYWTTPVSYSDPTYPYTAQTPQASPGRALSVRRSHAW